MTNAFPYLLDLNSPQKEAVLSDNNALLILAGAGTGKTRVLTAKIAHIICAKLAKAENILAVTFTNKAAREMEDRVAKYVDTKGMWIGTFHRICFRIIKTHAHVIGMDPEITILDDSDQVKVLKNIIEENEIKDVAPKSIQYQINLMKDRAIMPDDSDSEDPKVKIIYKHYQNKLKVLNAIDFSDMILQSINILNSSPEILDFYQNKFQYILVDEYQDSNVAQYLLLRLLFKNNIVCVGDDDQSIYSWRGAEISNILNFPKHFENAKIIKLEQNYRSPKEILAVASHLIGKNQMRHKKTVWSDKSFGNQVSVIKLWDSREESLYIANTIVNYINQGVSASSLAILIRASFQTREFEERFLIMGINYNIIGGIKFYERAEIKDILAYLHVIYNSKNGIAFSRIINTPKRGVGKAAMQKMWDIAYEENCSLKEACANLYQKGKNVKVDILMEQIEKWQGLMYKISIKELCEVVLEDTNYIGEVYEGKTDERTRKENIRELLNASAEFKSLEEFLEHTNFVSSRQDNAKGERVNIMTLHMSKGLEFEHVFLPGWEEGVFPSAKSGSSSEIEEERRLAYVGITRSRKTVNISYVTRRKIFNQWQQVSMSRFINDLPIHDVDWKGGRSFANTL